MPSSAHSWPVRVLRRVLRLGPGEGRTARDLARLRPFLRFAALFGLSIVVPAAMLSYFALASITAEQLQVDADLERRADTMVVQVVTEVQDILGGFEDRTLDRLRADQSPLDNLAELSPWLRAAFRYDAGGNLVAPFDLPSRVGPPEPTPLYRSSLAEGSRLERDGSFLAAAAAYGRAARSGTAPSHVAQAAYARARALWRADREQEAEQAFADLYAEYTNVRDQWGFRVGDLAQLARARIALARDPEAGEAALLSLVDGLLAERWTIERPGEAAVARRALYLLEGIAEPDQVTRARTRLDERTGQLYWAGAIVNEIELLTGDPGRLEVGEFRYVSHPDSPSLWALLWVGDALYAFSLDYQGVLRELQTTLARTDSLDDQISGEIVEPGTVLPPYVLSSNPLPKLTEGVIVHATDPEAILDLKRRMRRTRVVIIALAVGMSVLGVMLSLRLVRTELEAARVKADFAANVSHELRSPITQIRLKGEALQLELVYDEEDRSAHYDAIVHEAERLSRLVDNVLDFAAIERGAKRYHLRPDDLREVVDKAVDAARETAEAEGIALEVDVPEDLPVVWIDREAIGQVLTNLLSNATKYGGDGRWVGLRARVGLDGLDVSVSDRGMGIAPEDRGRIFDHFYRSSDAKVRRRKGTGIGLTIVRYIVEAHGGTITVDSTPGKGTTFTFTLPLEPPAEVGA